MLNRGAATFWPTATYDLMISDKCNEVARSARSIKEKTSKISDFDQLSHKCKLFLTQHLLSVNNHDITVKGVFISEISMALKTT